MRPYDPRRLPVCMDETTKRLVSDIQGPLAAQPGEPQRFDYKYKREGVASLFMYFEPLT